MTSHDKYTLNTVFVTVLFFTVSDKMKFKSVRQFGVYFHVWYRERFCPFVSSSYRKMLSPSNTSPELKKARYVSFLGAFLSNMRDCIAAAANTAMMIGIKINIS